MAQPMGPADRVTLQSAIYTMSDGLKLASPWIQDNDIFLFRP
jgi:hypothetical protein